MSSYALHLNSEIVKEQISILLPVDTNIIVSVNQRQRLLSAESQHRDSSTQQPQLHAALENILLTETLSI